MFGSAPNPLAVTVLWAALRERGYQGLRDLILGCYEVAGYAVARLNAAGCHASRADHSLTVRFTAPDTAAACAADRSAGAGGRYAQLSVSPQVTRATVDTLCRGLTAPPAARAAR